MSPSGKIVSSLVTCLCCVAFSASLLAQASPKLHGPPDWIEARPPIHVLPFVTGSPSGYSPTQMRHAYGFDQITGNGAGQVIGIVDAYGSSTIQSDLNNFCATFGLPATTVSIYYPQGVPGHNSGWALETSLDVEWAHAIGPGARIVLVVAASASLSNLLSAVDYAVALGAKQVSMSWGGNEFSTKASYDYHFNVGGVTFLASSGDSGAGVSWPASSPYVVGVGGTSLALDASGNVISETACSGSGGGLELMNRARLTRTRGKVHRTAACPI
jgi:subtilase family serine protease